MTFVTTKFGPFQYIAERAFDKDQDLLQKLTKSLHGSTESYKDFPGMGLRFFRNSAKIASVIGLRFYVSIHLEVNLQIRKRGMIGFSTVLITQLLLKPLYSTSATKEMSRKRKMNA